jgi:hypothetical protein
VGQGGGGPEILPTVGLLSHHAACVSATPPPPLFSPHTRARSPRACRYAFDWDNVFWPLNAFLAQETNKGTFHNHTQAFLRNWICDGNAAKYTIRGRAYNPMTGVWVEAWLGLLMQRSPPCYGQAHLAWDS